MFLEKIKENCSPDWAEYFNGDSCATSGWQPELNYISKQNGIKSLYNAEEDGKFISSVQIAGDTPYRFSRQTNIHERSFWLVKTGEDELYRVIKYSIEAESMPLHSN